MWVGMGSRLSKNIKLAIVREEHFFVAFLMNIVDTQKVIIFFFNYVTDCT